MEKNNNISNNKILLSILCLLIGIGISIYLIIKRFNGNIDVSGLRYWLDNWKLNILSIIFYLLATFFVKK